MRLFKPKTHPHEHSILSSLLASAVTRQVEEIIFEPHTEETTVTVMFHKKEGEKNPWLGLTDEMMNLLCSSLKKLAKTYDPETREGHFEVRLSDSSGSLQFNYDFNFTLHPTAARPEGNPHIIFDTLRPLGMSL